MSAVDVIPPVDAGLQRPRDLRSVLALSSEQLFELAQARGDHAGTVYAGSLYPPEAWLLVEAGAVRLVDVRTAEELKFVGHVPGSLHVAWQIGPGMTRNPRFVRELECRAGRELPLVLLCRSGKRSAAAAATAAAAGFEQVFNVLEGFEGDLDALQQRGDCGGWRHWGLPWVQD